MPGWIIQGVRGEGKSLAAVGKIKEYMLRGRPVATNLNLFLENFLPEDNVTIAYRLPDHPRLQDFQLLPPAYDPKYKGEDKNGLLVLDELGTWLNARNWNDKIRLEMLNWLFLSRKDHWDIILLAQDFEMIDAQVRTTLCDYLVQASRLDRQRIPYLGSALKFLGMNHMMPRVHRYHVYYGMSLQTNPVDTWTFTGKDFYTGYDTNQKFTNGMEPLGGTLVDMRATYSYVPANYLTRHVFRQRLQKQIEILSTPFEKKDEVQTMAKKGATPEISMMKAGILLACLVAFVAYKFFSGSFSIPGTKSTEPVLESSNTQTLPKVQTIAPADGDQRPSKKIDEPNPNAAMEVETVMDYLLKSFRPRASMVVYSPDDGFFGSIEFYDKNEVVERYSVEELHRLGVGLIHKPYGVDLVYRGKIYLVNSWQLPKSQNTDLKQIYPAEKQQQLSMK